MKRNKTFSAKPEKIERKWYVVDASEKILGRLATKISLVLRGKDEEIFTPSCDTGDFVIVINASRIKVSGKKLKDKTYFSHSMYPGGAKSINLEDQLAKDARKVILHAVRGMLPKGRLGDKLITKLKVFSDDKYPHSAQKPEVLNI
jgi:large subunit ribosomal protein L13